VPTAEPTERSVVELATLTERIPAPCLGRLPHDPDGMDLAAQDRGLAGALDLLNR
jgi:hypothetical protein